MAKSKINKSDLIFALDIGTRTIIAIAGEYTEDDELIVHSNKMAEHKKRSMHDGQIHDIESVSKTVKKLVEEIEDELEVEFETVSIAAAGRALRTVKTTIEMPLGDRLEVTRNHVDNLEIQAVKKAQDEINADVEKTGVKYYSVGYSVSGYYLDETKLDNLVGHKGERIGADVIATFLPRGVVESLYTVISKVGLEVGSMTLEPIAAMNVAIKKDLRLLNLALVDIGAGTSDIAITRDGEIVAYGMTQTAGDEITDEISRQFLIDFDDAEQLKISLMKESEHKFKNILGIEFTLTTDEVLEKVMPVIEGIASDISEKILEFNEKAPSAVFLVGGSSQLPKLPELIASKLGVQRERVVIRDLSAIDFVKNLEIQTPDYVTPVGIAIEGAADKYKSFIRVKFNGQDVRMFNTDKAQVSDLLLLTGFDIKKLMPKHSDEFVYFVEGRKRYLDSNGEGAKIFVNDVEGNIRTEIHNGDVVNIVEQETTVNKKTVGEAVEFDKHVEYEGVIIDLVKAVRVNGVEVDKDTVINPLDEIKIDEIRTYGDLKDFLDIQFYKCAVVDGDLMEDSEAVKTGAAVDFVDKPKIETEKPVPAFKQNIENASETKRINLSLNGEHVSYEYTKEDFVFVDLFDHVDIDLSSLHGTLVLTINGEPADYTKVLNNGDKIEIRWE